MIKKILIIFIVCMFLYPLSARGASAEEKRVVLAIIDTSSKEYASTTYNSIHKSAETILNYLGLKVRYHDIAKGLPDDNDMQGVRAIFTWFDRDAIPYAEAYCRWAVKQIEAGQKYIMFGNLGAFRDSMTDKPVPLDLVSDVFNSIGLEYAGNWTDNPFVIEVVDKDTRMVEFERTLDEDVGVYETFKSIDDDNKVYLTLNRTDIPDGESHVVVITPSGGFVYDTYEAFFNSYGFPEQWRVNPFLFFSEVLQLEGVPRYDTTTLFGRRICYSHIDGDGIRNISHIDHTTFSGEIIYDEILTKYEFPITASFITTDIDPEYMGSERLVDLAERILRLDDIETGVHGFTHPLDWERQLTAVAVRGYSYKAMTEDELGVASESHYGSASLVKVDREQYLTAEIKGATEYIDNDLDPKGKKAEVYQWTGDCMPPAEAIAMTKEIGLKNINGGDTRFDRFRPSYTGVAPLTRQVKGQVQMYTSNSNENIYTNLWAGPYFGFIHVIDTFKQTEIPTLVKAPPRRISPMNIYYHFYSGERQEALDSLKSVYDYVLGQDIIPVFTSHYLGVVSGFLSGEMNRIDDNVWEFTDYGLCRTVRLDGKDVYPDLDQSTGIIGFDKWQDHIYVHLDEGDHAVLYLATKPSKKPYLEEASTVLNDYEITDKSISFITRSFRPAVYKFANMRPGKSFPVSAFLPGLKDPIYKSKARADSTGKLLLKIPVKGPMSVVVDLSK